LQWREIHRVAKFSDGRLSVLPFVDLQASRGSPLAQCWRSETGQAADLSTFLVALTCQLDFLGAAVLAGFSSVGTKIGR
jgi:hypothetical protein